MESDRIARMGVLGLSAYSIWRARQRQAQLDCALKELSDLQQWTEHLIRLQEAQRNGILETQVYLHTMKAHLREGGHILSTARNATIQEATVRSVQVPEFPTIASVQSGAYHFANNQYGPPNHGGGYPARPNFIPSGFQHQSPIGYHPQPSSYGGSSDGQHFFPGSDSHRPGFPGPVRDSNSVGSLPPELSYSAHNVRNGHHGNGAIPDLHN